VEKRKDKSIMVEEKIYTVPLRKETLKAPNYARTKKAVKVLKSFLEKHLKKEVKIGKYLNLEMWKNGRRNPPGKIKVRVEEIKETTIAELIDAPREKVEEKEEKISIKKPKILGGGKKEEISKEEKVPKTRDLKEKTKKAIEKVPDKGIKQVDEKHKESEPDEKKHAHRKQEKVITERNGKN
jgi:large subunit ribosomal protein L31e